MPDNNIINPTEQQSELFLLQLVDSINVHEISAWPGAETAMDSCAQDIADDEEQEQQFLIGIAPQRYWLAHTCSTTAPDCLANIDRSRIAVTDISHALTLIRLSGVHVTDVLCKGLPIDLHPSEFPPGAAVTSAIEGIVVTVCNTGSSFDLYCRRSYTESLSHWLGDAAEEFLLRP